MVVLSKDEYDFIYSRLNSPSDVELMHNKMGFPFNMLFNILAKKITRNTLRSYYVVKKDAKKLYREWKKGKTIYQLSKKYNFPPVLMANFILNEAGYSKKFLKQALKDTSLFEDKRVKREVEKCIEKDFVYSPASSESQARNGKSAESEIALWLKSKRVGFETEKDSIALGRSKTPDFLLKKPIKIKGRKINWVESKSSFGDIREIRKNYRNQLKPYLELYGPGAVVYWYGYVKEHGFEDVLVLTKEDLLSEAV